MRERPKRQILRKVAVEHLGTVKKTPIVRQQFARIAAQMKPKNIIIEQWRWRWPQTLPKNLSECRIWGPRSKR